MGEESEISRRRFLEMAALIGAGTASSFAAALAAEDLGIPANRLTVLRSKNPKGGSWPEVVAQALAEPLGTAPLRSHALRGKRIAVMTDDWGRPTPASEIIPQVLDELRAAGAEDGLITFVTASGMHDPMKPADLERKLGREIVQRYRCVSHDAGDHRMLSFVGASELGTPIWVNRYVAEADFKLAIGRIAPHEAYGYEGGYKMIVPGVASFETILRDHSMNFSRHCVPGVHANPSRREADAIGAQVGIDFVINVVVNSRSEPVKAFAGKVAMVHPQGIRFGDEEVWGAVTPWRSHVTVVTLGPEEMLRDAPPVETLRRAAIVTREAGTIIVESSVDRLFVPEIGSEKVDEGILNSTDVASFNAMLAKLGPAEIMRIHELRDWKLDKRTIQHRVKAIRSAFYRIRSLTPLLKSQVHFSKNPAAKFKELVQSMPKDRLQVNILVGGQTTLPKLG
jgi:nickel-dependent lactate racemase